MILFNQRKAERLVLDCSGIEILISNYAVHSRVYVLKLSSALINFVNFTQKNKPLTSTP